jgi:O-antigen/teichoic acid export membrane protein
VNSSPARRFPFTITNQFGGSALVIAVGLSTTGLGTLLTMALTARWLAPRQYQGFVTWWAVATFFGAGFGVFETYISRLVVRALAQGRSPRPVIAVIAARAWMSVLLIAIASVALHSWLADSLFQGSLGAATLLPVFVAMAMLQCVQRGIATGHRYFIMSAAQFATDGVLRVVMVVAARAMFHPSIESFAAATCLSAACSVVVSFAMFPAARVRPRMRGFQVSWRPLGYLLVSMASVMLVNNGAVVWLSATHSVTAVTLGAFAGVMALSQIPTQLSSAVASPTLSHLAHALDTGNFVLFRRLHRRIIVVTFWLGLIFVGVFGLLGHDVLAIYLGRRFTLGRTYMVLLAGGSAVMLLAMVEQAVLNSRSKWRNVALTWTLATLGFFAALSLPVSTVLRASLAPLVSVTIAFLGMVVLNNRSVDDSQH